MMAKRKPEGRRDRFVQPFLLTIQPHQNNEVVATIFQQPYLAGNKGMAKAPQELASVTGLSFLALQDEILDALRANHLKPMILGNRNSVIELSEASGVRLAVLFRTVAPLSSLDAIRAMQRGLAAMSDEEIYYWFAKCYGETASQGIHALRVLHGVERVSVAAETQPVQDKPSSLCACGCGNPVVPHEGKGRPGKYWSSACRVRAHRAKPV